MTRTKTVALTLLAGAAMLTLSLASARGQEVVVSAAPAAGDAARAQARLMAVRAARLDGMRRLAERIKGLRITSSTYVKDFVAESDQIATGLDTFLKGMKEVGQPRYYSDGTAEVDMEITLVTVIQELKTLHERYYKGDKIKATDIVEMKQYNKETVIRETGSGATASGAPAAEGTRGALPRSATRSRYWDENVEARGRLMAERAARVDGIRKLAERIKGLRITSTTSVQDFVATSDEISTALDAFIQGIREKQLMYHADEPVVEAIVEVTLTTVYEQLKTSSDRYYKGDKVKASDFTECIRTAKDQVLQETGNGVVPEAYLKGARTPAVGVAVAAPPKPTWPGMITATGQAAVDTKNENVAQAKLMAMRAAELDARRKLAEQINGLRLSSSTTVRDFVALSDDIATDMATFQQGARVISSVVKDDGTAEAVVEIPTERLGTIVDFWVKSGKVKIK